MFINKLHIGLLLLNLFPAWVLHAQEQPKDTVKYDSIQVVGKSVIFLKDTSIYVEKDTFLIVEDSIARQYERDTISARDKKILDTLKSKVSERTLLNKILDPIIRWPSDNDGEQKYSTQLSVAVYDEYEGQVIDTIIVKRLDVFGTNINDTTVQDSSSWLKRTGNKLHINTHSYVILNNLLFKKGDKIEPHKLSDSERILRQLSFIKDARIVVEVPKNSQGPVKVIVITKDIWSIGGSGSLRGLKAVRLTVTDKNFLGLGHSLRNKIILDSRYKPIFGFESAYRISNFRNTFTNAELYIARTEYYKATGLEVHRDFISPDIKYGGGLQLSKESLFREHIIGDTLYRFPLAHRTYDAWIGRAISLDGFADRSNLTFSLRTLHLHYFERPTVSIDSNRIYSNTTSVLASVTFTRRLYHTSHLVTGYGITEDIPSGFKATLAYGKDFNEFGKRDYLGLVLAKGGYIGKYGYLRGELGFGGFFNGEDFEQGLIKSRFNYFSHLLRIRKYYIRQFLSLEIAKGLSNYNEDIIKINEENGIRGISNREIIGTQKITLNAETIAFSPYYFLGFRFAFFTFADLGMVGDSKSFLKGKLYQGYGFGVRFRNENLTFTTFQIRVGFYPVAPIGVSQFQFDFDEKPRLFIEDFVAGAPSIIRITPEE